MNQHGSFKRLPTVSGIFASPNPAPSGYGKRIKGDERTNDQDVRKALEKRAASRKKADHARTTQFFARRHSEVVYSKSDGAGMARGHGQQWIVAVTKRHLYYLTLGEGSNGGPPGVDGHVSFRLPGMIEAARQYALAHEGRALPPPASGRPTGPQVHRIAPLLDIEGVILSSSDARSVVLDFADEAAKELWPLSIVTFAEVEHRDEFVGTLLTAFKPVAYAAMKARGDVSALRRLYTASSTEPLLNVEHAKRVVSAVRLRRAIDDATAKQRGNRQALWINVEAEDYEDAARYNDIVAMIRSQGETTITMSTTVEWVKSKKEPEHRVGHMLILTEASLYLLLNEERSFRMDKGVGLLLRISTLEGVTVSGNTLQLAAAGRKKALMVRVLGTAHSAVAKSPSLGKSDYAPISSDAATKRIVEHLERIYLDLAQGARSLPVKRAKDIQGECGRRKLSKLERAVRHVALRLQRLSRGQKDRAILPLMGMAGGPGQRTAPNQVVPPCYKWLLAIMRRRMFDLIDTFNHIKATMDTTLENDLKIRRLGLSLIALCDHLDLSHQLVYECILYEIMSCAPRTSTEALDSRSNLDPSERDFAGLFRRDSFPLRLLSLYLNNRADQYARLVLAEPMLKLLREKGEADVDHYCAVLLNAFLAPENIRVIPHELAVVMAMIQRAAKEITEADLMGASPVLDFKKCIASFMIERLFGPAILSPEALNIKMKPTRAQVNVCSSTMDLLKAAIGYGAANFQSVQFATDHEEQIERYLAVLASKAAHFEEEAAGRTEAAALPPEGRRLSRPQTPCTPAPQAGGPAGAWGVTPPTPPSMNLLARWKSIGRGAGGSPEKEDMHDPRLGEITRQAVTDIRDEDVRPLVASLAGVHEALAFDIERIFVEAVLRIEKLNVDINDLEEHVAAPPPPPVGTFMVARIGSEVSDKLASNSSGSPPPTPVTARQTLSIASVELSPRVHGVGLPNSGLALQNSPAIATQSVNFSNCSGPTPNASSRLSRSPNATMPQVNAVIPRLQLTLMNPGLESSVSSEATHALDVSVPIPHVQIPTALRARRSLVSWALPEEPAWGLVALAGAVGAAGAGASLERIVAAHPSQHDATIKRLEAMVTSKHAEVKAMRKKVHANRQQLVAARKSAQASHVREEGGAAVSQMRDSAADAASATTRRFSMLQEKEVEEAPLQEPAGGEDYVAQRRSFHCMSYQVTEPAFLAKEAFPPPAPEDWGRVAEDYSSSDLSSSDVEDLLELLGVPQGAVEPDAPPVPSLSRAPSNVSSQAEPIKLRSPRLICAVEHAPVSPMQPRRANFKSWTSPFASAGVAESVCSTPPVVPAEPLAVPGTPPVDIDQPLLPLRTLPRSAAPSARLDADAAPARYTVRRPGLLEDDGSDDGIFVGDPDAMYLPDD